MNRNTDQRLRLTLRQLEVFVATCSAGSTRAAADRVARSQSAASNALAEIEATLGVELFDRAARRLVLNENGRALLPRAVALLEQAAEAEALFAAAHTAPLRLAASFTVGEYLLPALIAEWKATHPRSQVRLDIANTREVLDSVAAFTADMGFIEGSASHPELVVRRWIADELVVVAGPGHPLARRTASARQLARANWVVREEGSGTREAADRWLTTQLPSATIELELGSNEAVKRAVACGLGLGLLSRLAVAQALEAGWLVQVRTAAALPRRMLGIVTHRAKRLGLVTDDFLHHCVQRGKALDGTT